MRVRRQHHLLGLGRAARLLLLLLLLVLLVLLMVLVVVGRGARFAVPDQHGHGHPSGRRQRVRRGRRVMVHVHALLLLRAFRLVPVVLEPDFHLKRPSNRTIIHVPPSEPSGNTRLAADKQTSNVYEYTRCSLDPLCLKH